MGKLIAELYAPYWPITAYYWPITDLLLAYFRPITGLVLDPNKIKTKINIS